MPSLFLPTAVRFEYFNGDADVLGIGTASPRLSWQMPMAAAGFVQVSYEIEIERSGADRDVRGRFRGPGSRAVAGRSAEIAGARQCACACARPVRRMEWLERTGARRGRTPRPHGLDGPLRLPARHRRLGSARSRPLRGVLCARRRGVSPALFDGARNLCRRPQWSARVRGSVRTRLDRLRRAASLPGVRRHLSRRTRPQCADRPARKRLVSRPTRIPRRPSGLRGSARLSRAARDHDGIRRRDHHRH